MPSLSSCSRRSSSGAASSKPPGADIALSTPPREVTSRGGAPSFSSADFVGGLVLVAIGLAFGVGALTYGLGSPLQMGPGAFPFAAAAVLVTMGVIVAVRAFVAPSTEVVPDAVPEAEHHVDDLATALEDGVDAVEERPTRPQRFGSIPWRLTLFISAAVVWFALTVDGLGLLLAAFGAVVLASYARSELRWWQPFVAAAALTLASWLIFSVGLQLRVPLIGDWLGG